MIKQKTNKITPAHPSEKRQSRRSIIYAVAQKEEARPRSN
jgi:hypothetical protein